MVGKARRGRGAKRTAAAVPTEEQEPAEVPETSAADLEAGQLEAEGTEEFAGEMEESLEEETGGEMAAPQDVSLEEEMNEGDEELAGDGAGDDISWVEELWKQKKAEEAQADVEMADVEGELEKGTETENMTAEVESWLKPKLLPYFVSIPRVYDGPGFDGSSYQCCIRIYPVVHSDLLNENLTRTIAAMDYVRFAQLSHCTQDKLSSRRLELFSARSTLKEHMHSLLANAYKMNNVTVEIEQKKASGWTKVDDGDRKDLSVPTGFSSENLKSTILEWKSCYGRRTLGLKPPMKANMDQPVKDRTLFVNNLPSSVNKGYLKIVFPFCEEIAVVKVSEEISSAVLTMNTTKQVTDHLIAYTSLTLNGHRLELGGVKLSQKAALDQHYKKPKPAVRPEGTKRNASADGAREKREPRERRRIPRESSPRLAGPPRKGDPARRGPERMPRDFRREPERFPPPPRAQQRAAAHHFRQDQEIEMQMQMQRDMEMQREMERQHEVQMQRELEMHEMEMRELEMQREREIQREMEMQRDLETQYDQVEHLQREMQQESERHNSQRLRQEEMERQNMERQRQEEEERERLQRLAMERENMQRLQDDTIQKLKHVEDQQRRDRDAMVHMKRELELEKVRMKREMQEQEQHRRQQELQAQTELRRQLQEQEHKLQLQKKEQELSRKREREVEAQRLQHSRPSKRDAGQWNAYAQPDHKRWEGAPGVMDIPTPLGGPQRRSLELEVARQAEDLKKSLALLDKFQKDPSSVSASQLETHAGAGSKEIDRKSFSRTPQKASFGQDPYDVNRSHQQQQPYSGDFSQQNYAASNQNQGYDTSYKGYDQQFDPHTQYGGYQGHQGAGAYADWYGAQNQGQAATGGWGAGAEVKGAGGWPPKTSPDSRGKGKKYGVENQKGSKWSEGNASGGQGGNRSVGQGGNRSGGQGGNRSVGQGGNRNVGQGGNRGGGQGGNRDSQGGNRDSQGGNRDSQGGNRNSQGGGRAGGYQKQGGYY